MARCGLTKIVATIGPASEAAPFLQRAHRDGLAVARLNFSHGDHAEQKVRMDRIKHLNQHCPWRPIGLMLDTKGPELRIGRFVQPRVVVRAQQVVTIWTAHDKYQDHQCRADEITLSYDVSAKLRPATKILVDDGKLELIVVSVNAAQQRLTARALNTHTLIANKRVNIPGVAFDLPFLSARDERDIIFGLKQGVDFIALSFVGQVADVVAVRRLCAQHQQSGTPVQLISKIESQTGINNLEAIIAVSDGVMVARGDLGLEVPLEQLPFWQATMIVQCLRAGKVVIVATEMLDSMSHKPLPTRAEISDVYTATTALVDATMLSGETANGAFPALSVATMRRISAEAERHLRPDVAWTAASTTPAAWRACVTALVRHWTTSTTLVVVQSNDWQLVRFLSGLRWSVPVVLITTNRQLATGCSLWRGIQAYVGALDLNVAAPQVQLPAIIAESLAPYPPAATVLVVDQALAVRRCQLAPLPRGGATP